jgi:uncharacterized membrane protein (DUF4010 family)
MSHVINNISVDFLNFILVTLFSLIIGLEQRRQHQDSDEFIFGTDRTFTFIGILGFVLYLLSPTSFFPYLTGMAILAGLLAIFYYKKIESQKEYGITTLVVVFIVYGLGPLLYLKPVWFSVLVVTTVLILVELKPQFISLTTRFDEDEFTILAKFLVMAGIVLPLLSDKVISPEIPISPYKVWLAVVVISGISYLSYIIQKFFFPKSGMIITGFLGGMYSSTATTVVLARKSKSSNVATNVVSSAIVLATGVMFIRVLILAFIFNTSVAKALSVPVLSLSALTFVLSWLIYKFGGKGKSDKMGETKAKNPLEFKTAVLFAVLFVVFAVITQYVMKTYGTKGLDLLSLVVGVTDIDPFLLSLFTGKYDLSVDVLAHATLIAVTSNNVIKLGYGLFFGNKKIYKMLIFGFAVVIGVSVLIIVL